MNEKTKKNLIAYICAGKHSRSSTLVLNTEQRVTFNCILEDLKEFFNDLFLLNWSDIEISLFRKAPPSTTKTSKSSSN